MVRSRVTLFHVTLLAVSLYFIALRPPLAHAHILILQHSDQHGNIKRFARWLTMVYRRHEEHKKQFPRGRTVLILGGDTFGANSYSLHDKADFLVKTLGKLTTDMDVVFVPGNHDAFDWSSEGSGAELFKKQTLHLHRKGVHILGANIVPGKALKGVIKPHWTFRVKTKSGSRKFRIHGFTLNQFEKSSSYAVDGPEEQVIHEFLPVISQADSDNVLKQTLLKAVKDSVDVSVYQFHQGFKKTVAFVESLGKYEAKLTQADLEVPRVPVVFAAHDHQFASQIVDGKLVLDTGAKFKGLNEVVLSKKGEIIAQQAFTARDLKALTKKYAPGKKARALIRSVEREVEKIKGHLNEPVAWSQEGFAASKHDLKAGASDWGSLLASAHANWLRDELINRGDITLADSKRRVLGAYNSTSYRHDSVIPPGLISRHHIIDMYPMPGNSRGYRMLGEDVQLMYRLIRQYRIDKDDSYSPQVSSALAEKPGSNHDLLVQVDGHYESLRLNEYYYIAIDAWLSRNGFAVDGVDEILARAELIAELSTTELLLRYMPELLGTTDPMIIQERLSQRPSLDVDEDCEQMLLM